MVIRYSFIQILVLNFIALSSVYGAPLHEAARMGDAKRVKALLHKGADVNSLNENKHSALDLVVYNGHSQVLVELLKKGHGLNVKNSKGAKSLLTAGKQKHFKVARMLIESGADFNYADKNGITIAYWAVYHLDYKMLHYLAEKGAQLGYQYDYVPYRGRIYSANTLLHLAADFNHPKIVSLLLKKGVKVDSVNSRGQTPLYIALNKSYIPVVKLLVAKGEKIVPDSKVVNSALSRAIRQGDENSVKFLLKNGANPNKAFGVFKTPALLSTAMSHRSYGIFKALLNYGAKLHMTNPNRGGETALHVAAKNNNIRAVELLLSKGVNISIRDKNGLTPLDFANKNKNTKIVTLLEKHKP